ncbi:MAG: lycopene cyclase domain-containing protein [Thermoplasmatota archaeon]
MYLYLYLNILIFIFPFLLSFDRNVRFRRKWGRFIGSFLIVGTCFILWDIYATEIGHWSFNEDYLIGVHLFGIPLEEYLFFFTVPYACLFTYEVISFYFEEHMVPFKQWPYVFLGIILMYLGIAYGGQEYTSIVMIETGILLVVLPFAAPWMLRSRSFWIYLLVTLGLFLVFNMVLTAVPVVRYGPEYIWGGDGLWNGRFFTIPLEDFMYNASMLTWYLLAYLMIGRCMQERKQGEGMDE